MKAIVYLIAPSGVERYGLKKCSADRMQFTVRHNIIFAESHIPLHKWLRAICRYCQIVAVISAV